MTPTRPSDRLFTAEQVRDLLATTLTSANGYFSVRARANAIVASLEASGPTWDERVERAGRTLYPTSWAHMTDDERAAEAGRITRCARAAFPELAPEE